MMPQAGTLEKPFRTQCTASGCFSHNTDSWNYSNMR